VRAQQVQYQVVMSDHHAPYRTRPLLYPLDFISQHDNCHTPAIVPSVNHLLYCTWLAITSVEIDGVVVAAREIASV